MTEEITSMQVLVVDDDCVDREHIKRLLLKNDPNASITEAETFDEGIAAIEGNSFSIILVDFNLPNRNGIELLMEMKTNLIISDTAVIMMSTSEDDQLALDCIQSGAQDFLLKTEISVFRLRRAILNAQLRSEMETKLYRSYQETKKLAEQDILTGLANRYLFDETIKREIIDNERNSTFLALLLIDLDQFKYVNDNHGHDVGDELLKQVVERINSCLRGNELFARLGGDEFAITLSGLTDVSHAKLPANRIIEALEKPFNIGQNVITSGASIGISIYPHDGLNQTDLFKHSDIAMYRAKHLGRNQFVYYEKAFQEDHIEQYKLGVKLETALENNEFFLLYQPVINVYTGKICGAEALLRWTPINSPMIYPDKFIPIAEKTHSIINIGRWVIENAVDQLRQWNETCTTPLHMGINLSPVQLTDSGLVEFVISKLEAAQINPSLIEFELTETALLLDTHQSQKTLEELSGFGCKIALDDFGTGFSSISHLNQFPINTVKIDKSLMANSSTQSHHLVTGLVAMVKSLKLDVVAEGVEFSNNYKICKDLSIDRAQGYLFDRPLSVDALSEKYLKLA